MIKNSKIPSQYQTVMPYLIIPNAGKFIEFAEKVFGAELKFKAMRDEKTIMHAEIQISECSIMCADATSEYPAQPAGMFIYVENADESYHNALNEGASKITELMNQEYGRTGGVRDPFGNTWWITSVVEV